MINLLSHPVVLRIGLLIGFLPQVGGMKMVEKYKVGAIGSAKQAITSGPCAAKMPPRNAPFSLWFGMRAGTLAPFIILLLIVCSVPATAQDMTTRQNEILMTAIKADGWLTETMHSEFWSAVSKDVKSDPKAMAFIMATMEQGSLNAMQFQREAWGSMKKSLAAQRVLRTQNYESAKSSVLAFSTILQNRQQAESSVRNADAMIDAAAAGNPMVSQRGTFYVTAELIEQVLTGLDGSIHRIRRLTNPVWSTKVEEYSFPDVHVRILWDGPFRKEVSDLKVENGRTAKLVLLSHQVSEKDLVQIGFVGMQGQWTDPESAVSRTASSSLKAIGLSGVSPSTSRWRSRVSAEATGTAMTSDGPVNASIRIVEASEHGGCWQIVGISAGSLLDAIMLRETLEQSIQMDMNR
jgi:hypothetical protein